MKKTFCLLTTLILAGTIQAAPLKLDNYEAIKQELLTGNAVKVIVEFAKCQILFGDTGKPMRHIVGLMIDNFMISDKTKAITTSHSFMNSLDKRTPYGLIGYRLGDISVMPNNDVIVDTAVLRIPEYNAIGQIRFQCKMSEAAHFFSPNRN